MDLLAGEGLILRRQKSSEADLRLTMLMKSFGKFQIVVKGVQKPSSKLRPLLELFHLGDFQIAASRHSVYGRLVSGRLLSSFSSIRSDVKSYVCACRMAEVVDLLLPNRVPSPEVFDILHISLERLDLSHGHDHVWLFFVVHLLRSLGHGDCRQDLTSFFSDAERHQMGLLLLENIKPAKEKNEGLSDAGLRRALAYVERKLEMILPYRPKVDSIN